MRCVRTQIAYFFEGLIVAHSTHLKRPVDLYDPLNRINRHRMCMTDSKTYRHQGSEAILSVSG